jgi:hypothetical protein
MFLNLRVFCTMYECQTDIIHVQNEMCNLASDKAKHVNTASCLRHLKLLTPFKDYT